MQTLTRSRLKRLEDNGFTVFYCGTNYAFVRKWSKYSSMLKARFPIYVLVKVKNQNENGEAL